MTESFERKPYAVDLEIEGKYALFADPVVAVGGEKMTYMIPTYEAIKGALKSVYWKPTIEWYVDMVRVMNPIRTESMEVKLPKYNSQDNDLAYYTYLRNCRYQVRAHFEFNRNREKEFANDWDVIKHHEIAKRCIEKGARRDVYLGKRECQADVSPCVFGEGEGHYDNSGRIDFGVMYHGLIYPDQAFDSLTTGVLTTAFWRASMTDGIITYPMPSEITEQMRKTVRKMNMKSFSCAV